MTARIWTDDVLQNVYRLLRDGFSYCEIAEMYGVTRIAVRNRVNQTWVGPAFRAAAGVTRSKGVRFWTQERLAQVRTLYWQGFSVAKIAKRMGVTDAAAKKVVTDLGIADRKESAKRANARRIGTKHTPEAIAKMREKAKARFERPEYVARHRATHGREVMMQRARQANDKRRGFAIPDHLLDDYRNLTQRKGYRAREAGIALNIIPSEPASKEA